MSESDARTFDCGAARRDRPASALPFTVRSTAGARPARMLEIVLLVLAALLLAVFFTYPLPFHMGNRICELNDSKLTIYIQAWVSHALLTRPTHLLDMNMYYPAAHTLADSENLLGLQLFFGPAYVITKNPVFASNFVIVTSFALCFVAMYILLRCLLGDRQAAAIGALIYGFPFCRLAQMQTGHMQLLSMQWIPLIILFLYKFVAQRRRSSLVYMSLFVILQVLCSVYLGYLALIIMACFTAGLVLRCRRAISLSATRDFAASMFVCAVILGFVLFPYLKLARDGRINHAEVDEVTMQGSADPLASYLDVSGFPHNVYAHVLQRFGSRQLGWEKRVFQGFLPMLLCILAVVSAMGVKNSAAQSAASTHPQDSDQLASLQPALFAGALLTLAVTYILSLGPYLRIHDQPTHFRLPLFWLRQWVPGMAMFRVPARLALGVNFGVAVLAAFGYRLVGWAVERRSALPQKSLRSVLLVAACLILALEFRLGPVELQPVMTRRTVAPEYRWLAARPPGSVTLELPITYDAPEFPDPYEQVGYVYASVYHWQPLINGETGYPPAQSRDSYALASQLPSRPAVVALRRLGVRYILLHAERLTPPALRQWQREAAVNGLIQIQRFDDDCIVYEFGPTADSTGRERPRQPEK